MRSRLLTLVVQSLESLRGAEDTKKLGDDMIAGTPVTHYRCSIDMEEAIAAAPAKERSQLRAASPNAIPRAVDVWIDRGGLVPPESSTST